MADDMRQMLERFGGFRRIATLGVGILAVGAIIAVSKWATAPTWVPVLSGVPYEMSGEIASRLEEAGIPHRLENGGAEVRVAATDLARARVAIAREGMPTAGRPGLELFDKPSYAMTDFTQRINYRRALEGELERTIGKMRGVEQAQVHLALQETSTFRTSKSPSEASVVLKLRSGENPTADVVRGIAQLVASSVDGLESDRVTIVDDAGRLLSLPTESETIAGLTTRQLEVQRSVESHLEGKAEELINRMLGAGNARVQISATVNFDRVERTTQSLDPEKQVAATEQKAEIIPGAQGGAASSNVATTYENAKSTETFAPAIGGLKRLTVAVLVNDKQTGTADAPTFESRNIEELARIETLVKSAVGYDSTRGDMVSVVSVPFAIPVKPTVVPEVAPTMVERVRENQSLILNALALVLAFVIGFLALRSLRAPAAKPLAQLAGASNAAAALAPGTDMGEMRAGMRSMPELVAQQANVETRNRVTTTVEQQPEIAAKLVRAWMKE
jgi:flagellar M-ring protein FliF